MRNANLCGRNGTEQHLPRFLVLRSEMSCFKTLFWHHHFQPLGTDSKVAFSLNHIHVSHLYVLKITSQPASQPTPDLEHLMHSLNIPVDDDCFAICPAICSVDSQTENVVVLRCVHVLLLLLFGGHFSDILSIIASFFNVTSWCDLLTFRK